MMRCDWSDPGCDTTDTDDAEWLFCEHPSCPGLFLATGDSGHSFTSLPVVGGQVADLLEGKVRAGSLALILNFLSILIV